MYIVEYLKKGFDAWPLLILLGLAVPNATAAETYYLAPDGSDTAVGTTPGQPWQTFHHAFPKLSPGDTLLLLDGTYTPSAAGRFFADGFQDIRSGTKEAPITIKAQNERQAWIKSDGLDAAILLQNLQWWRLEGLRASNADNPEATKGGEGVKLINCRHMVIERGLFHHNNRYRNSQMVMIVLSRDVLVEESEIYHFHRNGFEGYRSEGITFRRCYANSRGYADLPDGRGSHKISDDGGDRAFVGYYVSNFVVENSISENKTEGFGFISGHPTNVVDAEALAEDPPDELTGYNSEYYARIAEDQPRSSGDRARFLGVISFRDNMGGAVQSREVTESSLPIRDVYFDNFVMYGPLRTGFVSRAGRDVTMEHVTVLQTSSYRRWGGNAFSASTSRHGQWPSCEAIGGCTFRFSNWLIANNDGTAVNNVPLNNENTDFRIAYANIYNNGGGIGLDENIGDSEGQIQHSMDEKPTGVGTGEGECLVYVPENSNMSGLGRGGSQIGANILYRYENGELTDEPLWNPVSGKFPHGAVAEGINDLPGNSLFDVHERLNVNSNGCTLPYSIGEDRVR